MRALIATATLASAMVIFTPSAAAAPPEHDDAPAAPSRRAPNVPLVVAGIAGAGAAYGLTAWKASTECTYLDSFCEAHRKELFVPFVGPLIHAGSLAASPLGREPDLVVDPIHLLFGNRGFRYFTVGVLVVDSAVQIGGVALATYGLFRRDAPKRAGERGPSLHPVVGVGHVGLSGEF